jgi:hypothetical protein
LVPVSSYRKFARTNYDTYEAIRPAIEAALPGYEKTAKNKTFKENVLWITKRKALDRNI